MSHDILPPGALAALQAGNRIEAIRQLRMATGMGVKEAKRWVDSHESAVAGGGSKPASAFAVPPEAVDALKRGDPGEAVRVVQEKIGGSLVEAKALVAHIQGTLPEMRIGPPRMGLPASKPAAKARSAHGPRLAPGEVPRGVGSRVWIPITVIAAMAVVAAFFLLR
jgi:hypothetical protein